jgi:hypothetical protein
MLWSNIAEKPQPHNGELTFSDDINKTLILVWALHDEVTDCLWAVSSTKLRDMFYGVISLQQQHD